jgi:hypothetical protein
MKKWWWAIVWLAGMTACNNDKKTGNAEQGIATVEDFIGTFSSEKLPYHLSDTAVKKTPKARLALSYQVFTKFIPDSLIIANFGRKEKPVFYPLAKIEVKKEETYLFVKAVKDKRRVVYVMVFNEDKKYVVGRPIMVTTTDAGTAQNILLDNKYTLTSNLQYRNTEGATIYKKNAYIFNKDAAALTLIFTESNDENASRATELQNPIDTFSKKTKYAGDYFQNKMNIVAIRDGKKGNELIFFIHFEKEEGSCKGELKGEAKWVNPTLAVYKESGNPCTLQFLFAGNTVTIKEEKACGTFRDIKCFFEGSFTKKKIIKPTKPSKPVKGGKR